MLFYCSEQMQNRELNTCKHDIYSFLHIPLPTNTEPTSGPVFFGLNHQVCAHTLAIFEIFA